MKTIATWIFDNYFLTQTYISIISFIKEIKGIDFKIRLIYCSKLNDDIGVEIAKLTPSAK
jgi:lipopolysaccharide biosynthesis glycosyltransferase